MKPNLVQTAKLGYNLRGLYRTERKGGGNLKQQNFKEFGLGEEMLKALEKLGFDSPTDVQEQVIPIVLENKDIVVKAQTGSGKTAAFGIPICEKIFLEERSPQALVLTPTRELAVQVKEDLSHIGRFKRIRCAAIFGKHSFEIQKNELRQRVHIIVGTPGRTFDHIERGNIALDKVKYLVIDEADKMLDMGFIDQVEAIIERLPTKRVTMLFSATMPDQIKKICEQYMHKAKMIEIESKVSTTDKINQFYFQIEEENKFSLVRKLIYTEKPESCVIFCNTREKVEYLLEKLKQDRFYCDGLHGGMEQTARLEVMQSFKKGEFHFLIATDVAARGIHIEDVTHVINYDLPLECESYVHRIGRTGRVEKTGVAITFVTPYEFKFLENLESFLEYKIPVREIPDEESVRQGHMDYEEIIKLKPKGKTLKGNELNREITRIRINSGKKSKMRPGDILGAITSIPGITADEIGIIDVQDTCSYIEIFGKNAFKILDALQKTKIKGKLQTVKKVSFRT